MVEPRKIMGGLGNRLFQFAYIYAQARKGLIPDVYIQDPKYFEGYEEEIRNLYGSGIEKIDMVAIHVRRTDYVGNPFYVDLMQTDYYEKAMAKFLKDEFLVFSDDIKWCKNQEIFNGCEFSEGKSEIEDLNLMASCKGVIMANSSFSWWGAFLSKGKVIAPKAWHPDGVERTKCPTTWKRL